MSGSFDFLPRIAAARTSRSGSAIGIDRSALPFGVHNSSCENARRMRSTPASRSTSATRSARASPLRQLAKNATAIAIRSVLVAALMSVVTTSRDGALASLLRCFCTFGSEGIASSTPCSTAVASTRRTMTRCCRGITPRSRIAASSERNSRAPMASIRKRPSVASLRRERDAIRCTCERAFWITAVMIHGRARSNDLVLLRGREHAIHIDGTTANDSRAPERCAFRRRASRAHDRRVVDSCEVATRRVDVETARREASSAMRPHNPVLGRGERTRQRQHDAVTWLRDRRAAGRVHDAHVLRKCRRAAFDVAVATIIHVVREHRYALHVDVGAFVVGVDGWTPGSVRVFRRRDHRRRQKAEQRRDLLRRPRRSLWTSPQGLAREMGDLDEHGRRARTHAGWRRRVLIAFERGDLLAKAAVRRHVPRARAG